MKEFSYTDFLKICESKGLDPRRTSIHKAECISRELDPENTNPHKLDCIKYGLDPSTTSAAELKKHKDEGETYQY